MIIPARPRQEQTPRIIGQPLANALSAVPTLQSGDALTVTGESRSLSDRDNPACAAGRSRAACNFAPISSTLSTISNLPNPTKISVQQLSA